MQKEIIEDIIFTFNQNPNTEISVNHKSAKIFKAITLEDYFSYLERKDELFFLNGTNLEDDQRSKNENIKSRNIISFDLDFKEIEEFGKDFPTRTPGEKLQACLKVWNEKKDALISASLEPWLVVFSGNGLHFHYRVEEAIEIDVSWRATYLATLRAIQDVLQLPLDEACCNAGRIFRLPFSWNCKPGTTPVQTAVFHHSNAFMDMDRQLETPAWGAAEAVDSADMLSSLNYSNETFEQIKKALEPGNIFKHFNFTAHNQESKNGQWWCTSPWRRSDRPLEKSSPSFVYTIDKKQWFCHSSGKGGDLLELIALMHSPELLSRSKEDFKKVVKIAEQITGIERRADVIPITINRAPNEEKIAQLIAGIPLDTPAKSLPIVLDPVFQALARSNDAFDMIYLQEIQLAFALQPKLITVFAKRIKDLRKEIRAGKVKEQRALQKEQQKEESEFSPAAYFSIFEKLAIKHDIVSGEAVKLHPASQMESRSGVLPYAITPARLEFCGTRKMKNFIRGHVLSLAEKNVSAHYTENMLEYWLKEKKKPELLIAPVDYMGEMTDNVMDSPIGTVVKSFVLEEGDHLFTHQEICEILLYWLTLAHLRGNDPSIRPAVPILVSSSENIGKDVAISTLIGWFNPYVKKVSFGKGSQEKELQYAFGTSRVQHIEEAERMMDMNPSFIRNLLSGDFSDTTLKGDNATTRITYRGCAIGSANSCDFMAPGADNSRLIPIVIEGIDRTAYRPTLELMGQIYAYSKIIAEKGIYEVPLELRDKIMNIRDWASQDSDGHYFRTLFIEYLRNAIQGTHYMDAAEQTKCIGTSIVEKIGVFEKIREERPEYRTTTNAGFNRLLRTAKCYSPFKKKWLLNRDGRMSSCRFYQISELFPDSKLVDLPGNSEEETTF